MRELEDILQVEETNEVWVEEMLVERKKSEQQMREEEDQGGGHEPGRT